MNNSKSFNSDIHFSEKTPQELSRSKYKKFNSTQKSEISKQVSIESLSKNDKKSQRFMIQFSSQKKSIVRDKSESTLNGFRTPRKIPQTPLKEKITPKPAQKKSNPLFLNELTLKFKILLRDLENLINSIKTELKKTIENILKNTHKQMLEFLTNEITSNRQQSSLKSSKIMDCSPKGKNLTTKYQFKILSEFESQNKLVDTESVELNKSFEQINKNLIESNESENKSGYNFSTMIKLREKIRKDANNPVRKNIKDKYIEQSKSKAEFQLSMTSSRGALSKKQRMEGNRVAANSIQKLQRQLNSLKNLLDE